MTVTVAFSRSFKRSFQNFAIVRLSDGSRNGLRGPSSAQSVRLQYRVGFWRNISTHQNRNDSLTPFRIIPQVARHYYMLGHMELCVLALTYCCWWWFRIHARLSKHEKTSRAAIRLLGVRLPVLILTTTALFICSILPPNEKMYILRQLLPDVSFL